MRSQGSQDSERRRRRSGKRALIVQAAKELFLKNGFSDTSMDAVTARANVSKPTVYSHFKGKRELLEAVVAETSAGVLSSLRFAVSNSLVDDLTKAGHKLAAIVASPEVLAWDRMVSAEAMRQPEIGRIFYECGPGRIVSAIAEILRAHAAAGRLRDVDLDEAADFFFGLLAGVPLLRNQLCGPSGESIDRSRVRRAVDAFCRAFAAA